MSPKDKVRVDKIQHCMACNRSSYAAHVKSAYTITSHLFEDSSQAKLVAETQEFSLQAPQHLDAAQGERMMRQGCPLHCLQQNKPSYAAHVKSAYAITSHLFEDGSRAKLVAETEASSLQAPQHLDAAQGYRTWRQGCPLQCLRQIELCRTRQISVHNHMTPI